MTIDGSTIVLHDSAITPPGSI